MLISSLLLANVWRKPDHSTNQYFSHMTDELKPGDKIVVEAHTVFVNGIRCHIQSFKANVVLDKGLDKKKRHVVEVANLSGRRNIERQYIKRDIPIPIKNKDPQFLVIKCVVCGIDRKIRPCDAKQITRCKDCQKDYSRDQARERQQQKKGVHEVKG